MRFALLSSPRGPLTLPDGRRVRVLPAPANMQFTGNALLAFVEAVNAAAISPEVAAVAVAAAPDLSPVPPVTPRQLRLWLLAHGATPADIDAQIAAIPDTAARERAQIEWTTATQYLHDHPLVQQIGATLSLSPAQIDDAFRAAALL